MSKEMYYNLLLGYLATISLVREQQFMLQARRQDQKGLSMLLAGTLQHLSLTIAGMELFLSSISHLPKQPPLAVRGPYLQKLLPQVGGHSLAGSAKLSLRPS